MRDLCYDDRAKGGELSLVVFPSLPSPNLVRFASPP